MSHLPFATRVQKFVLHTPQRPELYRNFSQQPYGDWFKPVAAVNVIQLCIDAGKLAPEDALLYHQHFRLVRDMLAEQHEHHRLINALAEYFDFAAYVRNYANSTDQLLRPLFIGDINETLSHLNLLAHLYFNEHVAEDDWLLIADTQTLLSSEWLLRLEAILSQLAPTSKNLESLAQHLEQTRLKNYQIAQAQELVLSSENQLLEQLQPVLERYHTNHVVNLETEVNNLAQAVTNPKAKLGEYVLEGQVPNAPAPSSNDLRNLQFISLNNRNIFTFAQLQREQLGKFAVYPSLTLDCQYGAFLDRVQSQLLQTTHLLPTRLTPRAEQVLSNYVLSFYLCDPVNYDAEGVPQEPADDNSNIFYQAPKPRNHFVVQQLQQVIALLAQTRDLRLIERQQVRLLGDHQPVRYAQPQLDRTLGTTLTTTINLQGQEHQVALIDAGKGKLLASPFGGQSVELVAMLNFTGQSFYLINKRALRHFMQQVRYVERGTGVEFDPRARLSTYDDSAQLNRHVALPPLGFCLDGLHLWLEFINNSFGYANPVLGQRSFIPGIYTATKEDRQRVLEANAMGLSFSSEHQLLESGRYDYVARYYKYVIDSHATDNFIAQFYAQPQAQQFQLYSSPDTSTWTRAQVDAVFDEAAYIRLKGSYAKPTVINRTLALRQLWRDIASNSQIANEDFVLIAFDHAQLRPHWQRDLNEIFAYLQMHRQDCNLLLCSGHTPAHRDFAKVTGTLEDYAQAHLHTQSQYIYSVNSFQELVAITSFRMINHSLMAIRKSMILELLAQGNDFTRRDGLFFDYYCFKPTSTIDSILMCNPPLALSASNQAIVQHDYLLQHVGADHYVVDNLEVESQTTPRYPGLRGYSATRLDSLAARSAWLPDFAVREFPGLPSNSWNDQEGFARTECNFYTDPNFARYGDVEDLNPEFVAQLRAGMSYPSPVAPQLDLVRKVHKYVINLKSSADRRTAFARQANVSDFKVLHAVVGANLTERDLDFFFDVEQINGRYRRELSRGEFGCALSHTQILRRVLDDESIASDEWVLVAEDDTRFNPHWYRYLNEILLYIEALPTDRRPRVINGAQNQIPHFNQQTPEKFVNTHILYSKTELYHQVTPEIAYAEIEQFFPAGAGFYLIRKSFLQENEARIRGRIDWVADDFHIYAPLRSGEFCYTNPMLGFDDPKLSSILEAERIAGIEKRKTALRNTPIYDPYKYCNNKSIVVLQRNLTQEQILEKFPDARIVPWEDFTHVPRAQQEEVFDFATFRQVYGREITINELNVAVQHFRAYQLIANLNISDFTFYFIVEDDATVVDNLVWHLNCICDYVDTRLDLDTVLIQTSNKYQEASLEHWLRTPKELEAAQIYPRENYLFNVNKHRSICITRKKENNGYKSYIILKFYAAKMIEHFLPQGKPFFLAGDFTQAYPYSQKAIAYVQPQLAV